MLGTCTLRPATAPHAPHASFYLPLWQEGAPIKRVAPNSDTSRPSLHVRGYLRPSRPPYAELHDYQWIDHYQVISHASPTPTPPCCPLTHTHRTLPAQSDALSVGTPLMLHCVFRMFADALAAEPLLQCVRDLTEQRAPTLTHPLSLHSAAATSASRALGEMRDSPTHVVPSQFLRHLSQRVRSVLSADGGARTPRASVIGSIATASATGLRNSTGRNRSSITGSGSSLAGAAAARAATKEPDGAGDSSPAQRTPEDGPPWDAPGGFVLAPITEGSDSDDSDPHSDLDGEGSDAAATSGNGHGAGAATGTRWQSQRRPGSGGGPPAPTELSRGTAPTEPSASARVASVQMLPQSSTEEQRHALLARLQRFASDVDGVAGACAG